MFKNEKTKDIRLQIKNLVQELSDISFQKTNFVSGVTPIPPSRKLIDGEKFKRLLFSGNLTRQPSMLNIKYKVSDKLINTDIIMNKTFWIGLQPALTKEMVDY